MASAIGGIAARFWHGSRRKLQRQRTTHAVQHLRRRHLIHKSQRTQYRVLNTRIIARVLVVDKQNNTTVTRRMVISRSHIDDNSCYIMNYDARIYFLFCFVILLLTLLVRVLLCPTIITIAFVGFRFGERGFRIRTS